MINFFKYKNFLLILVTSILFIIITIYIYQYIQVGNDYNFSRMRGYNYKSLINIFSFIATERSNLWPKSLIPEGYPMSNQQLYLGWGN